MSLASLNYERQPPVGNSLIDDDAGGVYIRILPDRLLGRSLCWFFALCGGAVLMFALSQIIWTLVGVLQSVPMLFAGILFFLIAAVVRYTPRRSFTTIHATQDGIEYAANEFAPRVVQRANIQRVFTRKIVFSKQIALGVKLTDGGEMLLGTGEPKEIEPMARAIHRVLNSTEQRKEIV